ncbi:MULTISPECIES: hypothetical protein [Psychrilyobacter]|uniref:Uncharacterized protein n=1 Tax=Psychrilyobacter piezotolerans TaxID=2293438 RepID=A0ABX9KJN8_9FUSO|nr:MULTISPECIES: hypothetical protein [Psychrilyobacter]MCS5421795.1 hypothetical protein [Psychrilyobacter sp. S5]NDI77027.1 hypothetical protein [Psychrilyobacter piezotolerans]RDE64644.1 hypothetical protein DV867_03625 [Psychrilyobacter sp. S5]REI42456.1 hypothetical protein DYH56_03625 [Psychrilyobacter piezotolerans]
MDVAARKKLDEIIKLLEKGATEKDILDKKFDGNKAKMAEWINKSFNEFTLKEKELLSFQKYEIVKQLKEKNMGIPVEALEILEQHEKRLRALELKLEDLQKLKNSEKKSK